MIYTVRILRDNKIFEYIFNNRREEADTWFNELQSRGLKPILKTTHDTTKHKTIDPKSSNTP